MKECKKEFVEKLCKFYSEEVNTEFGIEEMEYIARDSEEWVYVIFRSGGKKRFSVKGDSHQGILFDFVNFLSNFNKYEWIN